MKVTSYTSSGVKAQVTVADNLFGAEVNHVLLSQAVAIYMSNLRQGTSKVKTRSEVNRTKKKWFKQKGTGNARHGARTSNIFVGGGVSHGPNGMQNWTRALSQDMKHKALVSALSSQAANVVIHEGITALKGKTSEAHKLVATVASSEEKVLVLTDANTEALIRGFNNIEQVLLMSALRVSALEIVEADKIIVTPEAIKVLEQRLSGEKMAKPATKPAAKTETKAEAKVAKPAKTEVKKEVKKVAPAKKVAKATEAKPKKPAAAKKPAAKK